MDKTADDPVTKLSRIEYTYTDVISTIEERLLIEPDGHLKIEFFVGTSNSMRRADTQLTAEQTTRVIQAFQGWKHLDPFYPVSLERIMTISFDGYKVEGADNENAPTQLLEVKHVLDNIAVDALKGVASTPAATMATTVTPAEIAPDRTLRSDVIYQFQAQMGGPVLRREITVDKDGLLTLTEKTVGEGAHDPDVAAKIHLTDRQVEKLAQTMQNLPEGDRDYPGINGGPVFMIKYAGRAIKSGGLPDAPSAVKATQQLLEEYATDAKRWPE